MDFNFFLFLVSEVRVLRPFPAQSEVSEGLRMSLEDSGLHWPPEPQNLTLKIGQYEVYHFSGRFFCLLAL